MSRRDTKTPQKSLSAQRIIPAIAPFVSSALFFLSAVFVVFAPLPLILTTLRRGNRWGWAATLVNGVWVLLLGGWLSLAMYAVFVAGVALLLPWLLRHARSLEGACSLMLLAMAGIAGGIVLAAGWPQVKELFTSVADQAATLLSGGTNPSYTGGEATAAEWKQALLAELPSGVAVFSLLVVWINTHFILKLNPGRLLERLKLTPAFAREWKTPEWLVWPTIVVGAGAVWLPGGPVSMVAINLIRFLFAIYVLQGLSVATFFLDHWRVGGPLRWITFVGGVVFGAPLLLALGFFDLWFDFRGKFRQSLQS